jgi:hypothetical protein
MGRRREPLPPELRALSDPMRVAAAARGGVIAAAGARALGADSSAVRRLCGSGEWFRIRRGVYGDACFRSDDRSGHHRRCAAVLAGLRSGDAVVSHLSAARLLGLPLPPLVDARVAITRRPPAPDTGPRAASGIGIALHVSDYDDRDVRDVAGVPVLAGARLVVDCCAVVAPDSALAIADKALFRQLTTRAQLDDEVRRRRGQPGLPAARLVVQRARPGADSWFESSSRWWLLEAGLPTPELQRCFTDERGIVRAQVDMWFPEQRTVGEADGAGKYDEPGSLFAEKRREDWLRDTQQVEVVRWVPQEMRHEEGRRKVVARFQRAFARRQAS